MHDSGCHTASRQSLTRPLTNRGAAVHTSSPLLGVPVCDFVLCHWSNTALSQHTNAITSSRVAQHQHIFTAGDNIRRVCVAHKKCKLLKAAEQMREYQLRLCTVHTPSNSLIHYGFTRQRCCCCLPVQLDLLLVPNNKMRNHLSFIIPLNFIMTSCNAAEPVSLYSSGSQPVLASDLILTSQISGNPRDIFLFSHVITAFSQDVSAEIFLSPALYLSLIYIHKVKEYSRIFIF